MPTATPTPVPADTFIGESGNFGFSGEGGQAQNALINGPHGLYETSGNVLYFADMENNRARKVDPNAPTGTITTVAGNGLAGYNGEGSPATSKRLNLPRDVFVDGSGNVYIADTENCRVRKVSGGTISTVAGTGTCGYNGEGTATAKQLNRPSGVAVDASGNIYIADTDNCRVRKVSGGGAISTVAGTGTCGFTSEGGAATAARLNRPHDVYVLDEDLVIADTENHRIRRIDYPSGVIITVAGTGTQGFSGDGGAATSAKLSGPEALAVAGNRIFIADTGNDRIRRVNALTGVIETVMGVGGITTPVALNAPAGVAVGSLTVSNTDDHTIIGAAGIDPDTGEEDSTFRPIVGCGFGIATLDWALPVMLLGAVLFRRRLGVLLTSLASPLRRLYPSRASS